MLNKINDKSTIGKILPIISIVLTIILLVLKFTGILQINILWTLCPLLLYVLFVIIVLISLVIINKKKNKDKTSIEETNSDTNSD